VSVAAIIPARYASTRFPGKPLANQTGKPLIQHVYEVVRAAHRVDRVLVATDDSRIAEAVRAFGGEAMMTREDHVSGTDRVAEVVAGLDARLIVNVQGDEPEMDPGSIDTLVDLMDSRPDADMGSLACRFKRAEDVLNPACVKVVLDQRGNALYFSRSLIPYPRDARGQVAEPGGWLLHLGIYAYRREFLLELTRTPPADIERTEQLEQLRALYAGARIAMAVVAHESTGIDTPEQYAAFVERYRARSGQNAACSAGGFKDDTGRSRR
jgi:3-deoxy-manno-octulosonate cytidylyltransferase (CMP-KDO synthetase)